MILIDLVWSGLILFDFVWSWLILVDLDLTIQVLRPNTSNAYGTPNNQIISENVDAIGHTPQIFNRPSTGTVELSNQFKPIYQKIMNYLQKVSIIDSWPGWIWFPCQTYMSHISLNWLRSILFETVFCWTMCRISKLRKGCSWSPFLFGWTDKNRLCIAPSWSLQSPSLLVQKC